DIAQNDTLVLADSVSMVKLQTMFHEYECTIQREKGRCSRLSDKVSQLEEERANLKQVLEETPCGNFRRFVLKQEQEKHRNACMLHDKSCEQLRIKEEQYHAEVQERQKVELAKRNLELEMRALINSMNETQRLLAHERSTRTVQEGILTKHLCKQRELEEENMRNFTKMSYVSPLPTSYTNIPAAHWDSLFISLFLRLPQVDELSLQLQKEEMKCSKLEALNSDLKEQLSSLKTLSRTNEHLERGKRRLEEEVAGLQRQMESSRMDQNHLEHYCREAEERARLEVRQKLEEVNLFLQVTTYGNRNCQTFFKHRCFYRISLLFKSRSSRSEHRWFSSLPLPVTLSYTDNRCNFKLTFKCGSGLRYSLVKHSAFRLLDTPRLNKLLQSTSSLQQHRLEGPWHGLESSVNHGVERLSTNVSKVQGRICFLINLSNNSPETATKESHFCAS
uniref:CCDC144C-like coiled-coil domain-containing protein n=1 Tax=Paramormyrops kingsleyae TaxID=1676925 RepID=A0A3B3RTS6_9TELE